MHCPEVKSMTLLHGHVLQSCLGSYDPFGVEFIITSRMACVTMFMTHEEYIFYGTELSEQNCFYLYGTKSSHTLKLVLS